MQSRGRRLWTMLWRVVCSVVVGVCLGGVAGTGESGATVKQEVEDIFKAVQRFIPTKIKSVEKTDSKSAATRAKEKIYVDHDDSDEDDDVDELPVAPRIPQTSSEVGLRPVTFPIGIVMADNLYPLVVGKNVDSGKPFVMNLNKQHALVVARAAGGGDYKLLIPFPVMVGSHVGQEDDDDVSRPGYRNFQTPKPGHLRYHPMKYRTRKPLYGSYLVDSPSKFRPYDVSEEVSTHPREYAKNYQSYRQHSGEEPDSGEIRASKYPSHPRKKYPTPISYKNVKPRPGKEFNPSSIERPDTTVPGYNRVYPKPGIAYAVAGPKPNLPRKNVPLAYRQPQVGQYQYRNPNYNPYPSPTPRYPYHPSYQAPPPPARKAAVYPPTNYAGAYASVPKDFKPSPYLGNITEDTESHSAGRGPTSRPQADHYESYDDRPYQFTEQDYLDSLNSPDAHSSSGGVHHVTYHVDDYLGKIYEEMYYRLPPSPPPPPPSDNDRQGTQEFPSASYGVKVATINNQNKTETSRPKTESVSFQEVKQITS